MKNNKPILGIGNCAIKAGAYGNVWYRRMYFEKKNMVKRGHFHDFDHISLIATGSVRAINVDTGEIIGEFKAGEHIEVPKNMAHTIISLEDNTLAYCIQALRDEKLKEVIETDFNNPRWADMDKNNNKKIKYSPQKFKDK